MANRYQFNTELTGFIRLDEDGGKYNNRSFHFVIPPTVLEKMEQDRQELINWIKSKDNKRLGEGVPPWDEKGLVKYNYGEGDGSRKPKAEVLFVDAVGTPISKDVLKTVRGGTKVNLLCQQKPYAMGTFNTSFRVLGAQIIEIVTGNGAVDSGALSSDDIAEMFGKVDGFTQDEPAVRELVASAASEDSYDF